MDQPQVAYRLVFSRITFADNSICLPGLVQIADNKVKVVRLDIEFLALAHSIAQFVGLGDHRCPATSFAQILITCSQ